MHIFLVIFDTLRKDHVGAYGNPWIHTPNLDAFARDSVVFDNAYPECLPTLPYRRCIHTGARTFPYKYQNTTTPVRADSVHGLGWTPIPEHQDTLAEVLRDKYVTGFISDAYHQFKPGMNYARGFHQWEFIRGQESDPIRTATREGAPSDVPDIRRFYPVKEWPDGENSPQPNVRLLDQFLHNMRERTKEEDYLVARVFRAANHFVTQNWRRDDLFLCVDSFSPHELFDAPAYDLALYLDAEAAKKRRAAVLERHGTVANRWPGIPAAQLAHLRDPSMAFDNRWKDVGNYQRTPITPRYNTGGLYTAKELQYLRGAYASLVTLCDRWFGTFIATLKATNLYDDSLVILTCDHGHQLGEHDYVGKMPAGLFPELVDLVMMAKLPGNASAGKRVGGLITNAEVYPTILTAARADFPSHAGLPPQVEGRSLVKWDGNSLVPSGFERPYITCGFNSVVLCRTHEWAYITDVTRAFEYLWNIKDDPSMPEEKEAALEQPAGCNDLWKLIVKDMGGARVEVPKQNRDTWYDMA